MPSTTWQSFMKIAQRVKELWAAQGFIYRQTDRQMDRGQGNRYIPQISEFFLSESFQFLEVKLSIYLNLNRHVFVMTTRLLEKKENTTFWSLCFYSGFTQLSTIFQSHRDGVWMWQGAGAQCSLLGWNITLKTHDIRFNPVTFYWHRGQTSSDS